MTTASYAQQTEIKSTEMDDLARASAIPDIKSNGDISEPLKVVAISGNRLSTDITFKPSKAVSVFLQKFRPRVSAYNPAVPVREAPAAMAAPAVPAVRMRVRGASEADPRAGSARLGLAGS